jgi:hypothetical protein
LKGDKPANSDQIDVCLMAESDQPKKETVRIELPLPATGNPPEPMVEPREIVRIHPTAAFPSAGPRGDTVRIPPKSEPLRPSQKKTQPLVALTQVAPQNPPIDATTEEKSSMVLYWLLLGLSALILIIQIWTYFS